MDASQFVGQLRVVARDGTISDEIEILRNPPGRRPSNELLERARWYASLSEDQKRLLRSIIADAADRAMFGVLCVIDGVRAIEDVLKKGRLELHYIKDTSVLLNAPEADMLHDLWQVTSARAEKE